MKTQLANGLWMEFDDVGEGKAVVLIHGFPLSRAMWRPQIVTLQKDFRLIVPDLRGFGGTGGFGGPPSIEQMADDIHGLLGTLNIQEPICLAGMSMGGYIALAFTRKYGSKLRALILADTKADPDSSEAKANRDKSITFAETHAAIGIIDQMMPRMVAPETLGKKPDIVAEVRQMAGIQSTPGVIDALRAMRDRPDSTDLLSKISVPTLVVVGSQDVITTPAVAASLAGRIPGARQVTIQGAGHLSNLEQPALFNQAVRTFLLALP